MKILNNLKEQKWSYIFLVLALLLFVFSALFSMVFYFKVERLDLKQWLSGVCLSFATGLLIATFFSWRDKKRRVRDNAFKEAFLIRDFLNSAMDKVTEFGLTPETIQQYKLGTFSQQRPLIRTIKKYDLRLYKNIETFSEDISKIRAIKGIEEIFTLINRRNHIIKELNEFLAKYR